jgi:bifunctional oligoribonuclease and PAP phosphatase NrnA
MTDSQVKNFIALLKKSKKILLTTHINPDGDGIGSGLALMNELLKLGKKVDFINRDPLPRIYRFLPNSDRVKNTKKIKGRYDLAVILECPEQERNGGVMDFVKQADHTVNIDHHLGNGMYADLNIVDPKAAAVGVQLYQIMKTGGINITKDAATCLYTAIITDTGSFRYSNTTPGVHIIAAGLLKLGANPEGISSEVYASTIASTRLMHMMLKTLKTEKMAGWCVLTRKMFRVTGAHESETDNFINSIRSIRDVMVAMLFKELDKGAVKVSFRSKNGYDVNYLAKKFGGGGHKHASGAVIREPLKKAEKLVLSEVRKYFLKVKAK